MSWQILYWNQERVREALQRDEYDDASMTGRGRLDELIGLAEGLGVLQALPTCQPELTRAEGLRRLRRVVWKERLKAVVYVG